MIPMRAVRLQLGTLLAADPTTLAPAVSPNQIALIVADFTPNENLVAGDLTLGNSNGLGPIAGHTGAQAVALDPNTQQQVITILPGTGTWRWVSSGAFPPAIAVYGFALLDNALAVLLAVEKFPTAVIIQADGYQIDIDPVQMQLILNPIT